MKRSIKATLSAVADRLNAQRSVALKLRGARGWQPDGNVTVPANQPLPQAGDVVEVRYLYASPESGVLFQTVCLGVRDDITAAECGTSQLKFKPSDTDEDASPKPQPQLRSQSCARRGVGSFVFTPHQQLNERKPDGNQTARVRTLPVLSKVVPRNSSLHACRMLRVTRYETGTIQLQVTDIDAFASFTLEGQPGEPVDLLLAFDTLARTAKGCSPTDHLTLIQTDAGVSLRHQIAGRPVERVVDTLDIEEWPAVPDIREAAIPLDESIKEGVQRAFACCSSETTRAAIMGAWLDASHPKAHYVMGTDGNHLSSANSFRLDLKASQTVREYFEEWLVSIVRKNAAGTVERYRNTVHLFLKAIDRVADQPLRTLVPRHIDLFLNRRLDNGAAPKTAIVDVKTLGAALNRAER